MLPENHARSRALHGLTMTLALLPAATLDWVRWSAGVSFGGSLCETLVSLSLLAALEWFRQRRVESRGNPTSNWSDAIRLALAATVVPAIGEAAIRGLTGSGQPLEFVVLNGVRNLLWVLAVRGEPRRLLRLAAVLSLFLMMSVASVSDQSAVVVWIVVYSAVGLAWLIRWNWDEWGGAESVSSRTAIPWRGALAAIGCVVLLWSGLGMAAARPAIAVALRGFLPTSGGTWWADAWARAGVGDGEQLVGAQDQADAVGPVESDLFLGDDKPSLYDIASDLYGEPVRKNDGMDRTIALSSERFSENREAGQSQHAGREFSTVRRRDALQRKKLDDVNSPALAYVVGTTPLHLKLANFERFDGRVWRESESRSKQTLPPPLLNSTLEGDVWAELDAAWRSLGSGAPDRHEIKIVRLASSHVPTPPGFEAVRIDRMPGADLFTWDDDGSLALHRVRKIPPLTVIHVQSRADRDADRTTLFDQARLVEPTQPSEASVPTRREDAREANQVADGDRDDTPTLDERVSALARAWAGETPRGWPQVRQVLERLQAHCVLDPRAEVPAECTDSVAHFLCETRRGPDYQFASAAVVVLRSLGYRARLVGGLYGRSERFDWRARNTPLLAEDLHFWAEVSPDGRRWLAVEPSPGFTLREAPPGWRERWLAFSQAVTRAAWRQRWGLLAIALSVLGIVAVRRDLADLWRCWQYRRRMQRSLRDGVVVVLKILEQRTAWAGLARPKEATLRQWFERLSTTHGSSLSVGRDLLLAADWACYAPRETPLPRQLSADRVQSQCEELLSAWTWRRCRRCWRKQHAGKCQTCVVHTERSLEPTKELESC